MAKLVQMLDDAIAGLGPAENGTVYSLESVVLNIKKGKGSRDIWKRVESRSRKTCDT